MKKVFVGIVIGSTITLTTSVFADTIKEYILTKIEYPIYVNGNEFKSNELPALNFQGNTYLPLKAIGDALAKPVKWNDQLKRVEIGEVNVSTGNLEPLRGYTSVLKLNGDLYQVRNELYFFVDENGKYYIDSSLISSFLPLYAISENLYEIQKIDNPFLKGTIEAKISYQDHIDYQQKFASVNQNYWEYKLYNHNKSDFYFVSTKPNEEVGVIKKSSGGFNQYYIPFQDVLNKIGIKASIELDISNKMVIITMS